MSTFPTLAWYVITIALFKLFNTIPLTPHIIWTSIPLGCEGVQGPKGHPDEQPSNFLIKQRKRSCHKFGTNMPTSHYKAIITKASTSGYPKSWTHVITIKMPYCTHSHYITPWPQIMPCEAVAHTWQVWMALLPPVSASQASSPLWPPWHNHTFRIFLLLELHTILWVLSQYGQLKIVFHPPQCNIYPI